jgi:cytochrome d ubiquinol oxidase subunit II
MALVWLLFLRGIAIEFRNQIQNAVWERLWDVVFSALSPLVVISFGAALGNRVPRRAPRSVGPFLSSVREQLFYRSGRGHPRRVHAPRFSAWRNTAPCGWAFKTQATPQLRARQAARGLWCGVLAFATAITVVSFRVEPHLDESFRVRRERIPVPLRAVSGSGGDEGLLGSSAVARLLRLHYRNARQRRLSRRIAVQWRPSFP